MLIIEPNINRKSPTIRQIEFLLGQGGDAKPIKEGIYLIQGFGSTAFLPDYEHYPEFTSTGHDTYRGCYGVCDNVEQLLAHYPELEMSERKFVVTMTSVKKSEQPGDGGWRWHKWGEYIGTQDPQYEYLYDEKNIEEVFCFHIYEKL